MQAAIGALSSAVFQMRFHCPAAQSWGSQLQKRSPGVRKTAARNARIGDAREALAIRY